jgi:hypothetical protein
MALVIFEIGIVAVFILAFLIDISVNLRRANANLKKLIERCASSKA